MKRNGECITDAGTPKESDHFMSHARFMTVSKTIEDMMETPRVNVMIMTRETFRCLEKYLTKMGQENQTIPLSGVVIYFHRWLGDLIVYGNSENKVIKRIIETCENRKDDIFHQGIKNKEVIR